MCTLKFGVSEKETLTPGSWINMLGYEGHLPLWLLATPWTLCNLWQGDDVAVFISATLDLSDNVPNYRLPLQALINAAHAQ